MGIVLHSSVGEARWTSGLIMELANFCGISLCCTSTWNSNFRHEMGQTEKGLSPEFIYTFIKPALFE
jgi:hypothetical protein